MVPLHRWTYRDEVTDVDLNFLRLVHLLSDEMLASLQSVMAWHVERYAPRTLTNLMDRLTAMFQAIALTPNSRRTKLTAGDLVNYRSQLGKQREYYFSTLRSFLVRWSNLGYSGVDLDTVEFLRDLRVDNNPRGNAVATLDPKVGPISTIEHEGLLSELHNSYADQRISPSAYHLVLLLSYFGARTTQYAALKTKDLVLVKTQDGQVTYKLSIPRAKQGHISARTSFKERKLNRVAGDPLWEYCQQIEAEAVRQGLPKGEAPMFPDWDPACKGQLGFLHHHSPDSLSALLASALRSIKVWSERTGEKLHLPPVRFRRTIATNAALEGKSLHTIADILDHSDTQTAKVYVGVVPKILDRIDRAMAMDLAPLAQAFKGTLINSEENATRRSDRSSRIVDLRIDRSGIPFGSCGQHSFCGFAAPIACYTCRNFEPWRDGPHEKVLSTLLVRRDQLRNLGDAKIMEVNDRTILAVAEVIRLCSAAPISKIESK
ncbi:MAG: site-specific integrase [Rubrivivax sp.]|nr:MAG: site-specific integrase [Rubrivivax sp.]